MNVKTVDMSEADGYAVIALDIIIENLKEAGLYRPDLLYRGFNGMRIPILLKTGQDIIGEIIYCSTEEDGREHSGTKETENPFFYAFDTKKPALAVFNPDHLLLVTPMGYKFKNPLQKLEALVAVYTLNHLFE